MRLSLCMCVCALCVSAVGRCVYIPVSGYLEFCFCDSVGILNGTGVSISVTGVVLVAVCVSKSGSCRGCMFVYE